MSRRHSSTWGSTVVLAPPPKHGTFCSCGVWECDKLGVYCDRLESSTAKPDPLAVDLIAAFDRMAAGHRAAAKQRAEQAAELSDAERCVETVGSGADLRRCSRRATVGPYCTWCETRRGARSSSDDFAGAPAGLDDVPDNLPFAS